MSKKPHRFDGNEFRVENGGKVKLAKISTKAGSELNVKGDAKAAMANDLAALQEAQDRLFASATQSLLVIFQGMDASGKDGMIRHVMSGINPQGCRVHSFRAPSSEELGHHFLWRPMRYLPERGMICLFNRSYYEEVLVVRVHPEFLVPQKLHLPERLEDLWQERFEEIVQFESTLARHGTTVLKFFLHISPDEQKQRFIERLNEPEKNWKFNEGDLKERRHWKEYEHAFEEMLSATSTKACPWYIIPSDDKWYARAAVADIISARLEELGLEYPKVDKETRKRYRELAVELENDESQSSARKE